MKRIGLPILPALVIAGTSIGTTASALELGELEVQSNIGQPLRASIAYALGPNEVLSDYCISLAPAASGVPGLSQARIRVSDGVITLTGDAPLVEPLMAARVSVSCPYAPSITRDFMFFLDPVREPTETRFVAAPNPPATAQSVAPLTRPSQAARPEREPAPRPVAIGSQYRAQPGDTLSEIASRLEGRQVGLWPAVMAIFEANPGAFIDNDPNQLKAGSLLEIPLSAATGGVGSNAPTQVAETRPTVSEPVASSAPAAATTDDTAYLEPASASVYEPAIERATTEPATTYDAPEVGDITIDAPAAEEAEPFVSVEPVEESNIESVANDTVTPTVTEISDEPVTSVEDSAPVSARSAGSITVAPVVMETNTNSSSTTGVWWTLGGALALVIGIFAWRRRKAGDDTHQAPLVEARAPHPLRRATDDDSIEVRVIENTGADSIDFDLSDDSPTEENLALDADLFAGHGLSEAAEADNADFGFAETTDLDLEITEAAARATEEPETDIIPPLERTSTGSILESEVLPEDHDYDMSVIMDATKTPVPEEATERDLKAVVVHDSEKSLNEEGYTLSKEVDYDMLEQDYEDEMTATQALNKEIEKAARELASDLEKTVETPQPSTDETAALPMASVTELDVTSNMPAGNDDVISDLDDTGINEGLTLELPEENDATAELTAELTANMEAHEETAELEQASDADGSEDETAEMELTSGRTG